MISIGLSIVRTKAFALILGPTGVGLFGLYGSIIDLTRAIAGMGVNISGVRQIAKAVGTGKAEQVARTVTTLRRVAFATGALGSLLLLAFSKLVARLTFGDDSHTSAVAFLALAIFFGDISAAQGALVQGMRRIADLARINVLGAFYGTLFSIPIVYYFGVRGVAPSLVCVAAMAILTSWWYARKVKVARMRLSFMELIIESSGLLKLGIAFMASTLMSMGSAYIIRIIVIRRLGIEAVGFYQAAWALGGLYVGFILQAMGADFFPRLTAVADDHSKCNQLVNEQAEVGLLLAVPGVIATLFFAPIVIELFYSSKFGSAVEILRWLCLGMVLRVVSWPFGFILMAKGKGTTFILTELMSWTLLVVLVWGSVAYWGLKGTGIGFFGMYVLYTLGIYAVVRRMSGFRWSAANRRLGLTFAPLIAAVFVSWYALPPFTALIVGVLITACSGVYSLKTLCTLVPFERFPFAAQRVLRVFRLAPRGV